MRIVVVIFILVAPLLLLGGTVRMRVSADGVETFGGYNPLGASATVQHGGAGHALRIEAGRMLVRMDRLRVDGSAAVPHPAEPPEPIMVGLAAAGPATVPENSEAQYAGIGKFSDGTTGGVACVWDEDFEAAAISSNGLLSAGSVESNTTGAVTASYGGFESSTNVVVEDLQ